MVRVIGYALITFLILSAVLVAEYGLQWYGLGHPLLYYENTSYRYALRPNQQSRRFHGATVTIDSVGLRSPRTGPSPRTSKSCSSATA